MSSEQAKSALYGKLDNAISGLKIGYAFLVKQTYPVLECALYREKKIP